MTRTFIWALGLLMVSATLASAQAGAPVVGQTAHVYLNQVSVGWEGTEEDPHHHAEGGDLGGFTLFGALSPGGAPIARLALPWPPANPEETVPGFGIQNVPDGTYYVAAVKGIVQSAVIPPSAWSQVTIVYATCGQAPGAPGNLRRAASPSLDVVLYWDLAQGCQPESMQLEAGTSPGATDVGVYQVPVQSGWAGSAVPGTYYARVRARNRFGVSAPSNELQVVITDPNCSGPGAPLGLTYTIVNRRVTLSWQPPLNPGSRPIYRYVLTAGTVSGSSNVGSFLVNGTTLEADNVPSGTYYVRVAAVNYCAPAPGVPSSEVIIVVP